MTVLGFFLVVFILIIWSIYLGIRILLESQHIFEVKFDPNILEILRHVFDISENDLKAVRFDGLFFHVGKAKIPYQQFSAMKYLGSQEVRIYNTNLPHRTRWLYQRVSGGPDRRRKNNTEMHFTNRHEVELEGTPTKRLAIFSLDSGYSYPSTIGKFNEFLRFANLVDFKTSVEKYQSLKKHLLECEVKIQSLKSREAELLKALEASKRLNLKAVSGALDETVASLISEYSSIQTNLPNLERDAMTTRGEQNDFIQTMKDAKTISPHFRGKINTNQSSLNK